MIILKEIILLLIIIEPFEERLDGATDSLHAYAIGPRLFCLREFCYLAKRTMAARLLTAVSLVTA